ncbi:hypothetical protein ACQPYK_20000 [Streptosporangium sp. CA-135522]|uniref:hypothetical protein n=1 Tax=Streptosporangium sp. CA-135522 TaxID=3240072 RepID=UPI003D8DE8BC
MRLTRGTWVSAGIVSVVLAGGISVAAAASAGRIDKGQDPAPALEGNRPSSRHSPGSSPSQGTAAPSEDPAKDYVVSREINPDPQKVTGYWTEERLREADPLPMPAVEGTVVEGSADVIE